jgi:hypothetical protein
MSCAQYIARMGEMTVHSKYWSQDLKERAHLEELRTDERVLLKRISKK